ncbi:sensor histidine kinase [Paenibacillus thalictri]|uniref:HAMP domain-containing protein n=1 Tax=Paenibacillus thalictri TaxID=2527873 RepID=A0A4Q9DQ68_9BACL|nr:histidine kinase [Paenibacillus thalictri]TBL76533.1 HAMP domain-containing protein [Paenibacillus thalictri]
MNIFNKIAVLIVLLLVPILLLYSYSYRTSLRVIEHEIEDSNLNKLAFLTSQVELTLDQLSMLSVIISRDPALKDYLDKKAASNSFDQLRLDMSIVDKLTLQSATSIWINEFSIYFPGIRKTISTDYFMNSESFLRKQFSQGWTYENMSVGGPNRSLFVRHTLEPTVSYSEIDKADFIVEVGFSYENLINVLNEFKKGDKGDPFLYRKGIEPIMNRSGNPEKIKKLAAVLDEQPLETAGNQVIAIDGESYLVNYVQSKSLGWHFVDYVSLKQVWMPVTFSRNLFYCSLGLLLCLSFLAAFLLYRNVQIPIRRLIINVQRLKDGNYSYRLKLGINNEFDFLFKRFNEMAEQIQQLIEKVYAEKLRSREATLKQLQSQINPHFLYNSLFFIKNMARAKDEDAVVAMALNLGQYYRYSTRLEHANASVQEEIQLVHNYLNIQRLRMKRLKFNIDIPKEMMELQIPRLLVQPIVENAIVHGIEEKIGPAYIHIYGEMTSMTSRIIVEDNGAGMDSGKLQELQRKLNQSHDGEIGCGVWNVHQRLVYQFGSQAGLTLAQSRHGGIRAELSWPVGRLSMEPGSGGDG